jgi:hypothetical protein
MTVTVEPAG